MKSYARFSLLGHYGPAVRSVILADLILAGFSYLILALDSFFASIIPTLLLFTLCLIASGTVSAGYCRIFHRIAHKEEASARDLFFALMSAPGKIAALITVLTAVFLVWYIPFVLVITYLLPGWIREVRQGKTFSLVLLVLFIVLSLAILCLVISCELLYSQSIFLFMEHPDMDVQSLLENSRLLMTGHRLELLRLLLSFAGYILLSVLSLGLGFLWTVPYLMTTLACYYDQRKSW